MNVLAHGGAAGAVAEISFILIPVIIFFVLARVSKKRMEREEAEEEDAGSEKRMEREEAEEEDAGSEKRIEREEAEEEDGG